MIDFYGELRLPAYNSNVVRKLRRKSKYPPGSFDPMLSVVVLDEALSSELDSRGGSLPSLSVEVGGSPTVRAYATVLHETVHWWQHVGSVTGLLTGLTSAVQARVCIGYLRQLDGRVGKPILGVLHAERTRVGEGHPAWLAALRWRESELGLAFLSDPVHAFHRVRAQPFLYESVGHSIAMHHAAATWVIREILDSKGDWPPTHDSWIDLYERSVKSVDWFDVRSPSKIPLGARDIFEGQARIIELQYRCRAVELMTLSQAHRQGLLDGVYGACLWRFLETSKLEMPERIDGAILNLFLLICDIAINPSVGYPGELGPHCDLVRDVHPGLRFLRVCGVAREQLASLLPMLKEPSAEAFKQCARSLCEPLAWSPPDEVASNVAKRFEDSAGGARLREERRRGDFGSEDTPVKLVLSEHQAFVETKAKYPQFFCWPAYYLTVAGEADSTTLEYQELLARFSPPFTASSRLSGVDTCSLHGVPGAAKSLLVSRYFMTQAIYDLVAQWIARPDRFDFSYSWKPSMSSDDLANLKGSFRATFDRDIDEIPLG